MAPISMTTPYIIDIVYHYLLTFKGTQDWEASPMNSWKCLLSSTIRNLVSKLTNWFVDATYIKSIALAIYRLWMKWYYNSTCLVLQWNSKSLTRSMAFWLLQCKGVGRVWGTPMMEKRQHNQKLPWWFN
jgi:hypothetical protein